MLYYPIIEVTDYKVIAEINIKSMEDMTMNNSEKETISTGKKAIFIILAIIAIAAAFGLIYGIVRANSMIIFQASSLAAIDTSIICLNFRNIKPANKKSRLNERILKTLYRLKRR